MRNADTVLGIIQDRYALEQGSLESHVIRKAVMRGSERGRWKSTHLGNSLAAYSTSRRCALKLGGGSSKTENTLKPVPASHKLLTVNLRLNLD
jgi:hypothetical protein